MDVTFRDATRDDLPTLVAMLADDPLGATREDVSDPVADAYAEAFDAIERDPDDTLLVALDEAGAVAGFLQLTFLAGLARRGAWRAQIEGVRVRSDLRGHGVGEALVAEAVERARRRGCRLVQLTSDKTRDGALRFYERLGFRATHEGFKLALE